jgi:hypothetical protein
MNTKTNVATPLQFKEKLIELMDNVYELFELTKEQNLEPVTDDGCTQYTEDHGKTCSQVAGQFSRPSEYLESLLDMIRVNYEQLPFSYFLNGNMGFLFDAIPDKPFQLCYLSITSALNVRFNSFWQDDVVPYIEKCGYSVSESAAAFAVVSTGEGNFRPEHLENVTKTLSAGFTTDEIGAYLLDSISKKSVKRSEKLPTKQIYTGLCLDSGLANKIRVSLWLIIERPVTHVECDSASQVNSTN